MAVRTIAFHVTDRCQLDCKHCLRDPEQRPADLDFGVMTKVLDEVARVYETRHMAMTGGEPTLYPHFIDAVDAAVERGMTWHMVSNGRRFGWLMERFAERPERGAAMSQVYFSLDGADQATHDHIRGKGSFRDVMSAVSLAQAHNVKFTLQMVVNALNKHQIELFGLLASQLGAQRASFATLQPTGTHYDKVLFVDASEWKVLADRVSRLQQTLTLPINTPEGWPQDQPFHVCEPFRSEQLHVDIHGRLNICCQQAGTPQSPNPPSGESDVVADLRTSTVVEAHDKMIDVIHRAQKAKLRQVAAGTFTEWDYFGCNWCLKHFGKPHWTSEGAQGPDAERERWTGQWGEAKGQAPSKLRLKIVA